MPVVVAQYLGTLLAIAVIDGIWLGFVARRFYAEAHGPLMREPVLWPAAVAFYLVYAAGVVVPAIGRAGPEAGWTTPLLFGAMLGFTAYATYDLTNLATLRGFPPALALVDLAWGTVLTAAAATAGWWAGRLAG